MTKGTTKYYAGIGSRNTPKDILEKMTTLAGILESLGYILRSGGADGADSAFESGLDYPDCEIYLPYPGFNNNKSDLIFDKFENKDQTDDLIKKYHPNPYAVFRKSYIRNLMGRNCYQILGRDLNTPVDFVVCWTEDGKLKGGTAFAIRIANDLGIPVFNLGSMSYDEVIEQLKSIVGGDCEWK